MANINRELNDIKNAVYGRDVRDSIHDGIDKINKESEESKGKADEAHDVMESIMNEGFDNAALESNFEQKLDNKIANLQPEWTQFKEDTETQLAQTDTKLNQIALTPHNIVFDGTTDNYNALQSIIDDGHGEVILPDSSTVFLSKPLDLTNSDVSLIDLRNSVVKAPNGAFIDERFYRDRATIINGVLDGVDKSQPNIGVRLGTERNWGASIQLKNIEITNFNIGLYGQSVFNLSADKLFINNCNIGRYFHNNESNLSVSFSNVNKMGDVTTMDCKYALYFHNSENMLFINDTMDYNEFGVVVGSTVNKIKFINTWFERNSIANVTAGTIDLETMELTKASSNRELKNVRFETTRHRLDATRTPMFDPHFKFASKYYPFDGDFDDYGNTFRNNKLAYENLVFNLSSSTSNAGSNTSVTYKDTPFGRLRVANARFNGEQTSLSARYQVPLIEDEIKRNNVYLLKALVYIEKPEEGFSDHTFNLRIDNTSGFPITRAWENDVNVVTDKWVEVSTIATVTGDVSPTCYFATMFNYAPGSPNPSDPVYQGTIDFSVTNLMVVNLTDIFGDDVPLNGSEDIISEFFPYKFPYVLPEGRYLGDVTFSRRFGQRKFVYWNGVEWVDMVGEVLE